MIDLTDTLATLPIGPWCVNRERVKLHDSKKEVRNLCCCSVSFDYEHVCLWTKYRGIYKDEHYDDIVALEDDIIRDLYNSSLSEPGINSLDHASGIDFEMAQKVYVFSPNDLLSSISCDDFGEVYSDKGQLVWRVPIEISSDTCDYAIIG